MGRHGSEICNVGERVHKCHQWDGYEYGTRQVPDKRIGRVDKKSTMYSEARTVGWGPGVTQLWGGSLAVSVRGAELPTAGERGLK